MNNLQLLSYLVVFLGVINLLRMTLFLVGSRIYELKNHIHKLRYAKRSGQILPTMSVVIPAHNEENTILRNLSSILKNDYPKEKLEILFIDDGSSDNTVKLVQEFKKFHKASHIRIIKQAQSGKAHALNNGMKKATGELVMCLDADSYIAEDALKNMARHFSDKKVMAVAAYVRIIEHESLLNLIQRFEYIICYQMKRAQTVFNIEYIVGGIGSTFRKSMLSKIGYYDTDTVTEDIDLTMKILREGNKENKVIYGADVVAYTEACLSVKALIKQRFRWKYGRSQTFLKNIPMFFNTDKRHSKALTWFYLPFAIFCDLAFFLEPFLIAYMLYIIINFQDIVTLLSAISVITIYMMLNILGETSLSRREKWQLFFFAPPMYFCFYLLSYVEYVALIKTLIGLPTLKKSLEKGISKWDHVERPTRTDSFTLSA